MKQICSPLSSKCMWITPAVSSSCKNDSITHEYANPDNHRSSINVTTSRVTGNETNNEIVLQERKVLVLNLVL